MTSAVTRTTKLGAVNEMLEAIGEAPVASLTGTGLQDVDIAVSILDRTTKDVLLEGWHFNTDVDFELSLDGDSKIPIPSNALTCDAHDAATNVTERNGFLWDRDDHTYTFTAGLKCDIVRAFEFDEVPEPAREYIKMLAMRKFAKRIMGDIEAVSYTDEDVSRARWQLEKYDDDHADHSLRQDATTMNVVGQFRYGIGELY